MNDFVSVVRVVVVIAVLALSACGGTQPSRFYMLTGLAPPAREAPGEVADGVAIGIGPVKFAEYLERKAIVRFRNGSEIYVAEGHRWAESLRENFTRVLAGNLSVLLETRRVVVYPWPGKLAPDYRVSIEVQQFNAGPDNDVILVALWSVIDTQTDPIDQLGVFEKSVIREPAESGEYSAIVAAHSRAVEQLSREIATTIAKLKSQDPDL